MEGCPRISLRMRCRVREFVVWKLQDYTPGKLRDCQVYMIEATVMIVIMMMAMIVASMKIMTIIMRTIFETTVMMMIMTTTIVVTVMVAKM